MKDIKHAVYKIGKVRIPDYILGTISAFVLIIGFPYVAQSQQSAEISTETVGDGRYVLFGRGGNILASIGDQGVLIVDSQFPDMVPKYQSTIRSLGGDDIDFTISLTLAFGPFSFIVDGKVWGFHPGLYGLIANLFCAVAGSLWMIQGED